MKLVRMILQAFLMQKNMNKILSGINRLTNHPVYQLVVSISLIVVSFYDMAQVIIKDFVCLRWHKEHFIILVGVLMLINALSMLVKGVKGIEEVIEEESK